VSRPAELNVKGNNMDISELVAVASSSATDDLISLKAQRHPYIEVEFEVRKCARKRVFKALRGRFPAAPILAWTYHDDDVVLFIISAEMTPSKRLAFRRAWGLQR